MTTEQKHTHTPAGPSRLTRRGIFAAQAMQGMLSNDDWDWSPATTHISAQIAVRFADALLAALNE